MAIVFIVLGVVLVIIVVILVLLLFFKKTMLPPTNTDLKIKDYYPMSSKEDNPIEKFKKNIAERKVIEENKKLLEEQSNNLKKEIELKEIEKETLKNKVIESYGKDIVKRIKEKYPTAQFYQMSQSTNNK